MAMGAMSASASLGRLEGWAPCLGQTRNISAAADSGAAWYGDGALPTAAPSSPHALAVGGHVSEDPKQELASVARLEGGGDDDKAALGLVCPQEDAARVDVDGASSPVLQAVHAVLSVLLHLVDVKANGQIFTLAIPAGGLFRPLLDTDQHFIFWLLDIKDVLQGQQRKKHCGKTVPDTGLPAP